MTYTSFATPAQPAFCAPRWALLAIAAAVLCACQPSDRAAATAQTPAVDPPVAATLAPIAAVSYTPPTADALYQMVAPIALYPDKLVALVLAGAIHPDQISSAYGWLGQNPSVNADAVNQQPWDPSVKALTAFPNALNLLQSNLPWTTALGLAYNNDPTDVLNAIQVMRQRASKAGKLASNHYVRVTSASSAPAYTPNAAAVTAYSGPAVVQPPADYIAIEPTQAQTVYVPSYDPRLVYGEPVAYYSGYHYQPPLVQEVGTGGVNPILVGALAFGAGVALTAAFEHHDWGYNNWGVHWGDRAAQSQWRPGGPPLPPQARPAVTYRQSTYVSNVVNNIRVDSHNNVYNAAPGPVAARAPAPTAALPVAIPQPAPAVQHHEAAVAGAAVAGAMGAGALAAQHAAPPAPHATPNALPPAPATAAHVDRRGAVPPVVARPSAGPAAGPRITDSHALAGRDPGHPQPALPAGKLAAPAPSVTHAAPVVVPPVRQQALVQRPQPVPAPVAAAHGVAPPEAARPATKPPAEAAVRPPAPAPHAPMPAAPAPAPAPRTVVREQPAPSAPVQAQHESAPHREVQAPRPEPHAAAPQARKEERKDERKDEHKER